MSTLRPNINNIETLLIITVMQTFMLQQIGSLNVRTTPANILKFAQHTIIHMHLRL